MPELHERITQQIDATERLAREAAGSLWQMALGDQSVSATMLRRCAADRRILELHRPTDCGAHGCDCTNKCAACDWTESQEQGRDPHWGYPDPHVYPCPTIRALAEGYGLTTGEQQADRPVEQPARLVKVDGVLTEGDYDTAREALRQMAADPRDPHTGLVVKEYRDHGQRKWVFRCWGTDRCDGFLSLDHSSERSAQRARDRHIAEDHQGEQP